jgi:hypothetical protein
MMLSITYPTATSGVALIVFSTTKSRIALLNATLGGTSIVHEGVREVG